MSASEANNEQQPPGMAPSRRFTQCDVLVVGAGPAGAATAAHLARSGVRVLLLDQSSFPRDKVCGDFVGPVALRELERLKVNTLPGFYHTNPIRTASLYLNGEALICQRFPRIDRLPGFGRIIPRLALDGWIVSSAVAAGAQIWDGARVLSARWSSKWVTVNVQTSKGGKALIRTKLLVGADGSTSLIARLLRGATTQRSDRIIAVRAYVEGIEGPTDQADLYFSQDCFPGYFWLFPTGARGANVGAGMLLETFPTQTSHLRDLLLNSFTSDRALHDRVRRAKVEGKVVGWPLSTFNPAAPVVGPRCLLVGDAAGLVNPLNGEGIQQALLSARWASEIVVANVEADRFSAEALFAYAKRVHSELRFDMAVCSLVVQIIRNRTLVPVWFAFLKAIARRAQTDAAFARLAGGILAGMVPAKWALAMALPATEEVLLSAVSEGCQDWQSGPDRLVARYGPVIRRGTRMLAESARSRGEVREWAFRLGWHLCDLLNQAGLFEGTPSVCA